MVGYVSKDQIPEDKFLTKEQFVRRMYGHTQTKKNQYLRNKHFEADDVAYDTSLKIAKKHRNAKSK